MCQQRWQVLSDALLLARLEEKDSEGNASEPSASYVAQSVDRLISVLHDVETWCGPLAAGDDRAGTLLSDARALLVHAQAYRERRARNHRTGGHTSG